MNTLKRGCQENFYLHQQQPWQMGICTQELEVPSQQESYDQQTNSSGSTIMHQIGSPASAFYAAEKYMGFSQYDNQQAKKFGPETPLYQQSGHGFYADSSDQVESTGYNSRRSLERPAFSNSDYNGSYEKPFKIPCNRLLEREKILELQRKLLDDFDSSDRRQLPSFPYDGNPNLSTISENVCGSQLAPTRLSPRPSALVSANCVNPGAVIASKTRIRWTQDLHDRFVQCVNSLGGAEKATPKAILKLMDSKGLTIFHVKSHLQKYRIAKYMPDSTEGKIDKRTSIEIDNKTGLQITEALQMQLDVQKRLHEQLEIQRNLQLRIEEQGRQLKKMLDQQQKTTRSFMETQKSDITSLDDQQSTSPEDAETTNFPSKIS